MRRKMEGNVPDSRNAALFVAVVGSTCTQIFSNMAPILYHFDRGLIHRTPFLRIGENVLQKKVY